MQQSEVEVQLARAERYAGGGDALGAERLLGPLIAYPDVLASGAAWERAVTTLARVAGALSWPREVRSALKTDAGDADGLATAGAALLTARRPGLAAGLLGRAVSLSPGRVGPPTEDEAPSPSASATRPRRTGSSRTTASSARCSPSPRPRTPCRV